ncbi:MAG: hypothetical protein ACLPKB_19835 [Xanthobacteraceae bacterium]
MSACVRVGVAALFVAALTMGSECGHTAEVPESKAIRTAFIVAPLPVEDFTDLEDAFLVSGIFKWVIEGAVNWAFRELGKELAIRSADEFSKRLCEKDGEFRVKTAGWMLRQKNWLSQATEDWEFFGLKRFILRNIDKYISQYAKDDQTLSESIRVLLDCDAVNLVARVGEVEVAVKVLQSDLGSIKGSKKSGTEETQSSETEEIQKNLIEYGKTLKDLKEILVGKNGKDGIKRDVEDVKSEISELKGKVIRQLPRRATKPKHFRKHRYLVPCGCEPAWNLTQNGTNEWTFTAFGRSSGKDHRIPGHGSQQN